MQDADTQPATDLAVKSIQAHGPMTARALYEAVDGFEDIEHCSRVLASLATREPVRLVRRMVDNPNKGQGNRSQVYQYDTPERGFQGTASGPDLFEDVQQSPGEAPAAGPAGGVPNNTGSREGGASFPVPDPTVGVSEASGAFDRASDAGHVAAEAFEALKADLDAVIGQRDALLAWLGVDDFLEAEPRVNWLRRERHDAINDVAGYKAIMRVVTRSMRRQLERDNAKRPASLARVPREQWPAAVRDPKRLEVWISQHYLVQVFDAGLGRLRLSVNRTQVDPHGRWVDGLTWDDLQAIKREIGCGDMYAVEVYPRDRDEVNVANMRHLWLLNDPLDIGWFSDEICSDLMGVAP